MDSGDVERLGSQFRGRAQTEATAVFVGVMNHYVETSAPCYFYFNPDETYKELVELLGIDEVDGSAVLATNYYNEMAYYSDLNNEPSYEGKWPLQAVINDIGDRYVNIVEFVNNFKAKVAIAIDEKTAVVFMVEIDEQPGICDDCRGNDEYMEHNENYSCDHDVPDEYDIKHSAMILDRTDLERFDWERGEVRAQS